MVSQNIYTALILVIACERIAELVISQRNGRISLARGGSEFGSSHYPLMVALHTGFLVACLGEVVFLDRAFDPVQAAVMGILALLAQGLRWWVIGTLGSQWNTRVIVVPGASRVTTGPFRFLKHPNYLAVICEGIALPLIHNAWLTALTFSLLNLWLLRVRIRCEEKALAFLRRP